MFTQIFRLISIRSGRAVVTLIVLGLALVNPAQAGLLISETNAESVEKHYYADGVYYQFTDGKIEASYDPARNHCLNVNHDNQTYFMGPCDEMFRDSLAVISGFYQAYQNDESISDMQRAMDAEALKAVSELNKVELTQVSLGTDKHLGFAAERFELRYQGKPVKEVWISEPLRKLVQQQFDLAAFEKQMRDYSAKIKKAMPFDPSDPISRVVEQLELQGILVKELPVAGADSFYPMAFTGGMALINHREVVAVDPKAKPDPALLQAPARYRKCESWRDYLVLQMGDSE